MDKIVKFKLCNARLQMRVIDRTKYLIKLLPLFVLLTKRSHPSYVVMSAEACQQLIVKLAELEDRLLGQQAEVALNQSQMVGVEEFTQAIQRLANGEA